MYPVSSAFLEAVKANTRNYYWTGRITTTAGTVYEFDQDDMVKGSGYITSQCCGSMEIELGTVYAAEMRISLFSEINRYTLEDAKVELFYHLQVAGGSYERIPMGIFEVSEANRKAKCLEIKAYDYMVRFEKAFTSLESIGNAYDFMVLCSMACNVALAQDRATIEGMPNGSENLSIYSDNDIETYRDVLFYVGQVFGGFFVINRAGELELRKYGNTPVLTVERKHRGGSTGMSKNRSSAHQRAQREGRERDHNTCQICGSTDHVEGHHLIDHQYGGGADADNIIALCKECHKDVHRGLIDLIRRR